MKTTKIAMSLALALGAAGLSACGGDEPGTTCDAAPIALTQGTWCITITSSTSANCPTDVAAPFWVNLTQTGTALAMTSEFGISYAGSLCGNVGTVVASGPPADVVNTITFTGANAGTGSAQWNTGSCSGTDTFTAASGSCP